MPAEDATGSVPVTMVRVRDRAAVREVAARLRRWWWVVVVLAIIGGLGAQALASRVQVYRASTTMLVGASTDTPFVHIDDVEASERLTRALVDIVPQEAVLDGVIDALGLDTTWRGLQGRIHAMVEGRSERLIRVTASASSPTEASAIVMAIPSHVEEVAFGPDGAPNLAETRGFLWSRIDAMRRHIAHAQRQVLELERQLARPDRALATRLRLDAARSLLDRWVQAMAAAYRGVADASSAEHLAVVETPTVSGPTVPAPVLDLAGAAVGGLIAVAIASIVTFAARRRRAATPAHAV